MVNEAKQKVKVSKNPVDPIPCRHHFWNMKTPEHFNWSLINSGLDECGYCQLPQMFSSAECLEMIALYPNHDLYRSTINMKRYRFGQGEYRYFRYPLPEKIQSMREQFYGPLSATANRWMQMLSIDTQFPAEHNGLLRRCHEVNQQRPTPLILSYESGGFNTLHQDLYGDIWFPFQLLVLLSEPDKDFTGGEFVMVEQIPRAQSRAVVIHLRQGDGLIFTTNFRPGQSSRGYYQAKMKHGVSTIRSGQRHALGIIFHDAL
jgi:hypothetical protein